jgi:ABC-type uncharacterized transport system substrate-binding protein
MHRRSFIVFLTSGLISRALAARVQPGLPVVGYINAAAASESLDLVQAFKQGLEASRFVEGRNVAIEYRWADDHYDRLPALVAELARNRVAVLAATSTPVALAAKTATSTIPVAFTIGGDPVRLGLVASLDRPGGNLTGVTRYNVDLGPKRLELLHEVVPTSSIVGLLLNPTNPNTEMQLSAVHEASRTLGINIRVLKVSGDDDMEPAIASLGRLGCDALAIANDPYFNSRSQQLADLTLQYRIPTIYQYRKFAEAGGLMSYGASNIDSHRQLGIYVARILSGAKPADLPVEQSTKLDLFINLKTARQLGLAVPQMLLALADEVIE